MGDVAEAASATATHLDRTPVTSAYFSTQPAFYKTTSKSTWGNFMLNTEEKRFDDSLNKMLNGPPSACYLPVTHGKTPGYNGRTLPASVGQNRTASNSNRWTSA